MAALPDFAGTVAPADLLTKLDQQRVELDTRKAVADAARAATEARVTRVERAAYPAGFALGAVAAAFLATTILTPAALASKGYAAVPGGIGADSDGKVAVVQLTPTRFVVQTWETNSQTAVSVLRATVFEISPTGSLQQLATVVYGTNTAGWSVANLALLGGFRLSDTSCRLAAHFSYSASIGWMNLATLTFDPVGLTLSATTDAGGNHNQNHLYATGALHRRRAFPVGAYGAFIPRLQAAQNWNGGLLPSIGGYLLERQAGSASVLPRQLSGICSSYSQAIDRVGDSLLAVLSDGYGTGPGGVIAQVALANLDDRASGGPVVLPLGSPLSGNARLSALTGILLVAGFTSGSQYATYAIARDAATNKLRVVGGSSIVGALGTVPVEIVPLGPTRFLQLVKGSGWTLTGTVYTVDPNAADGATPFVQGNAFSVNLGTAIAGSTAGDNVVVTAVEQVTGDRLIVCYRNTTRNVSGVEILDIA